MRSRPTSDAAVTAQGKGRCSIVGTVRRDGAPIPAQVSATFLETPDEWRARSRRFPDAFEALALTRRLPSTAAGAVRAGAVQETNIVIGERPLA